MKHVMTRCALFLAAVVFAPLMGAQTTADEIAFTRAQIQADRQAIVAATLDLPEEKGEAFWPMYREYRAEIDVQGDRLWKLLSDFADKYESLSDADAKAMLDEWISIEKKHADIRGRWAGKLSKKIGAPSTARFFQIENKLDSIVRLELAVDVPLARPAK